MSASGAGLGPAELDIACRRLVELITGYLEGVLDAPAVAAFEAHLDACPPCVVYLEQMRQTIAELGRLPTDGLDAGTKRDLLAAFRELRVPPA